MCRVLSIWTSAGKSERDDRGVDVSEIGETGFGERGASRVHLDGIEAGDPPGQVEEVDGLLPHLPAGDCDVFQRMHGGPRLVS
jgi:hypothetical protein